MLSKRISSLPLEHVLWLTPSGPVSVREALRMARSRVIYNFLNKRVVIAVDDNEALVKTITAIDGIAESALLIPQGLSIESRYSMISKFSPDIFITSENEIDNSFPDIPCISYSMLTSDETSLLSEIIEWPEISTRWVLPTSGTTGPPKLVSHSVDSLSRSINKHYLKGNKYRWGLLFDVTRFAGMQVFLQSLFAGSTLVIPGIEDDLENRILFFMETGVNACSATPTMWRKLLMLPCVRELKLKQITLGGEISDQPLLTKLNQIFPDARIVHIYASTEAGVGFSISDAISGFPKSFISKPPAGIQLRINERGILCLRSNSTDQQYIGESNSLYDSDGFIETGDVVTLEGERYHFLGRINGAINVGGNKVHPEEIESVAVGFPGVRMAHAYGKKSAFTGNVVAIDIALDNPIENISEFKRTFLDYCSTMLADFKVPTSIRFVDDLSSNITGKIARSSK